MASFGSLLGLTLLTLSILLSARTLAVRQQPDEISTISYAQLDDASARKLVKGCSLPREVSGPGAPGSQIVAQFTVSEEGKLLTIDRVQGPLTHQLSATLVGCHFTPYKVNRVKTAFQANIVFNVK